MIEGDVCGVVVKLLVRWAGLAGAPPVEESDFGAAASKDHPG